MVSRLVAGLRTRCHALRLTASLTTTLLSARSALSRMLPGVRSAARSHEGPHSSSRSALHGALIPTPLNAPPWMMPRPCRYCRPDATWCSSDSAVRCVAPGKAALSGLTLSGRRVSGTQSVRERPPAHLLLLDKRALLHGRPQRARAQLLRAKGNANHSSDACSFSTPRPRQKAWAGSAPRAAAPAPGRPCTCARRPRPRTWPTALARRPAQCPRPAPAAAAAQHGGEAAAPAPGRPYRAGEPQDFSHLHQPARHGCHERVVRHALDVVVVRGHLWKRKGTAEPQRVRQGKTCAPQNKEHRRVVQTHYVQVAQAGRDGRLHDGAHVRQAGLVGRRSAAAALVAVTRLKDDSLDGHRQPTPRACKAPTCACHNARLSCILPCTLASHRTSAAPRYTVPPPPCPSTCSSVNCAARVAPGLHAEEPSATLCSAQTTQPLDGYGAPCQPPRCRPAAGSPACAPPATGPPSPPFRCPCSCRRRPETAARRRSPAGAPPPRS